MRCPLEVGRRDVNMGTGFYMVMLLLLLLLCFSLGAQSETNVHLYQLMTETERRTLLDANYHVSPHKIIFVHSSHFQRQPSPTLRLSFRALNKTFNLQLERNNKLLMPEFLIHEISTNNITDVPWSLNSECFYQGFSREHPNSVAAISICDGMKGVIQISDGIYVIQPLPVNLVKRLGIKSNKSVPHLIVKKEDSNEYVCPHAQRKKNFHVIEKSLRMKQPLDFGNRYRRSTKVDHPMIETAVFVDQTLYEKLKQRFRTNPDQKIITYILTMMNAVQILFRHPSLGHSPEIKLVELNILKKQPEDLESSENIDTYLTNFCIWQLKRRKKSNIWWDHALLLSGINMYVIDELGRRKKHVVGLAPVSGMCNPLNSCTISEGTSFQTVLVVGHEFGHSVGMEHDGRQDDNHCNPEKFIMSHTLGPGKTTWSSCSREYLEKFLRSSQSRCLRSTNSGVNMLKKLSPVFLPGQAYDANQQCQMRYGESSRLSTIHSSEEICHMLRCDVGFGGKDVSFSAHPALEGTSCGRNKWCQGGTCISSRWRQNGGGPVNGAWGPWSSFGPCSSDCIISRNVDAVGMMISTRRCDSPRPNNGGHYCKGIDKRFRICDASRVCSAAARAMTLDEYITETCQQAAHLDQTLDPTGTQFPSHDNSHSCYVWCHKRRGGYITHGWKLPDGTPCWRGYHSQNQYCFQGKCNTFDCNGYTIETSNEIACPNRPSLPTAHISEWGKWQKASDCQHSCIYGGVGYNLVTRECNTVTGCTGVHESFQLCETTNKCPKMQTAEVYATNLCKKYRNRYPTVLSGKGRQLPLRSGNPHAACVVACQDQVWQGTHYQMDAFEDGKFPSGTDCSGGRTRKKAYCLNGKCIEFSDGKIPKNDDSNNIIQVKKLFKYSREKRDLTEETYIDGNNIINHSTSDNSKYDTILEVKNQESNLFKNKFMAENFHKYIYKWAIEMSECSESCGGGERNISIFCVKGSILVDDMFCKSTMKPIQPGIHLCNTHLCTGKWHTAPWGTCSKTCGIGIKSRHIFCVVRWSENLYSIVTHTNCPREKPLTTEKCTMPECSKK